MKLSIFGNLFNPIEISLTHIPKSCPYEFIFNEKFMYPVYSDLISNHDSYKTEIFLDEDLEINSILSAFQGYDFIGIGFCASDDIKILENIYTCGKLLYNQSKIGYIDFFEHNSDKSFLFRKNLIAILNSDDEDKKNKVDFILNSFLIPIKITYKPDGYLIKSGNYTDLHHRDRFLLFLKNNKISHFRIMGKKGEKLYMSFVKILHTFENERKEIPVVEEESQFINFSAEKSVYKILKKGSNDKDFFIEHAEEKFKVIFSPNFYESLNLELIEDRISLYLLLTDFYKYFLFDNKTAFLYSDLKENREFFEPMFEDRICDIEELMNIKAVPKQQNLPYPIYNVVFENGKEAQALEELKKQFYKKSKELIPQRLNVAFNTTGNVCNNKTVQSITLY